MYTSIQIFIKNRSMKKRDIAVILYTKHILFFLNRR